jgi:DNA repair exonuclease SbcCD ATPase subunit
MTPELLRIVDRRLEATKAREEPWSLLVLAACDSADVLAAALDGEAPEAKRTIARAERQPQERPGAYLAEIGVEGFRGVGPKRTLELEPTAGLTLVVGRNGSGKSSFAEGVEILLTGTNSRWAKRSRIWREGWRNLHHTTKTAVDAAFVIDGQKGETTLTRQWPPDGDLDSSTLTARNAEKQKVNLDSLGWASAVETFRPFLSYNELGSTFDEGPTEFHDRLSRILGLGEIEDAQQLLRKARLQRQAIVDDVKSRLASLLGQLDGLDDPRAQAARAALGARKWDLDKAEQALATAGTEDANAGDLPVLRFLASLSTPDPEDIRIARADLAAAAARDREIAAQPAGEARDVVQLLQLALRHFEQHGEGDCPVCGKRLALLPSWKARTEARLEDLRKRTKEADDAAAALSGARRTVNALLQEPPAQLATAGQRVDIDVTDLLAAWQAYASAPTPESDLAETLATAAETVRQQARTEIERREQLWAPVARALTAWLVAARESQTAANQVAELKAAESWLKDTSGEIRAERFGPIADEAIKLWTLLRQQSSVELERVLLTGSGAQRQVKIDVTIDGVASAALGVMSQGELHAMALSLFLPRATLPESPFRFVVIDDPVQSMDPARVDGLARVLDEVAKTRQVVVFTHDDRLPESVRRLGIDARVVAVTRRQNSEVDLMTSVDPVERNLDDAEAISQDRGVPDDVSRSVVPGYCRAAIEATAIEIVRRRRIGRGEPHADVDALLERNAQTKLLLSLVFFDTASKGGEVGGKVAPWGIWATETLNAVVQGAHGKSGIMPLDELVPNTRKFCAKLRQAAK